MKITRKEHFITTLASGNRANIIGYILDAEKQGKTVYIQSGIHGGEITYWLVHKLFNFLKQNLVAGKIVFVPCANPIAWMQRIYGYTAGKFNWYNGNDWNRNFPKGDSLEGIIAENLFNYAKESDFVLDLHTSRHSNPFAIPSQESYLQYCKTLGLEYNYLHVDLDNVKYHGTINAQLDLLKIPNLTIECGSHGEYSPVKIEEVFEGILRLLADFGMVDKKFAKQSSVDVKYFTETRKITAIDGGFIKFHKTINEIFKKGDIIYSLYNPNNFGEEINFIADFDGIAWKFTQTHVFMRGEDVLDTIPLTALRRIADYC